MKHMMRDTISVYPTPVKDEYGKDIFSTSTAYKGRFVERTKVLLGPKGDNITSEAEVWLPAETPLSIGDKLSYASQGYRVIQMSKQKDANTVRFIKAYLERYEI